jgi:hypothetical protein
VIEALHIEQESKSCADLSRAQCCDATFDEPRIDAGLLSAESCSLYCLGYQIDACHVPPALGQVDGPAPGPAAKIEYRPVRRLVVGLLACKKGVELRSDVFGVLLPGFEANGIRKAIVTAHRPPNL